MLKVRVSKYCSKPLLFCLGFSLGFLGVLGFFFQMSESYQVQDVLINLRESQYTDAYMKTRGSNSVTSNSFRAG